MKRLRVKRVDEVALVDKGDNPAAHIVIQKRMEKAGKTEDGRAFPAKDYAYVPDPEKPSTWKLRLTSTPGGGPDPKIVGAAVAAMGPGFRGQKVEIPAGAMGGVKAKVRAAWKACHPDAKPEDMPAVLKAQWLARAAVALGLSQEVAKQLGIEAETFDEVRRWDESWDASDEIGEYAMDLATAIRSAVQAGDQASARASIAQFAALLESKLPDYFGAPVEKQENDMADTEKVGFWRKLLKALDAKPEDIEAAIQADPPADPPENKEEAVADEVQKAEIAALTKRAEEAEAKVAAAEAEKAEAVQKAAALEIAKREAEAVQKVATWAHLSVKPEFAKALRKIRDGEKLDEGEVAEFERVLDAAEAIAKTSKVFAEIGTAGQTGSAFQKVQALAAKEREADPKLTIEQARAAVYKAHPELKQEVEQETAAARQAGS